MGLDSKHKVLTAACLVMGALALGCGDDDGDDTGNGGGNEETQVGTVVPITADSAEEFIATPHKVFLINADNGEPLDPPFEATSNPANGQVTMPVVREGNVGIYIEGTGPAGGTSSTYDAIVLNHNWDSGDGLLRISSAGTLSLAADTGGFEARDDRGSLTGSVYWTTDGKQRKGVIGCAKLYLDGATMPDEDQSQRYIGPNPLPYPLAAQPYTNPARGSFYFGNIEKGMHNVKVSLDDGETFIADVDFYVPATRAEARSPTKSILAVLGIDVVAPSNPTPADCE